MHRMSISKQLDGHWICACFSDASNTTQRLQNFYRYKSVFAPTWSTDRKDLYSS